MIVAAARSEIALRTNAFWLFNNSMQTFAFLTFSGYFSSKLVALLCAMISSGQDDATFLYLQLYFWRFIAVSDKM